MIYLRATRNMTRWLGIFIKDTFKKPLLYSQKTDLLCTTYRKHKSNPSPNIQQLLIVRKARGYSAQESSYGECSMNFCIDNVLRGPRACRISSPLRLPGPHRLLLRPNWRISHITFNPLLCFRLDSLQPVEKVCQVIAEILDTLILVRQFTI